MVNRVMILILFSFISCGMVYYNDSSKVKINDEQTVSGCIFYYGKQFYFFPNTEIENIDQIFSDKSRHMCFRLLGICSNFFLGDSTDMYFSTIKIDNNNPKLEYWNRIHYSRVELSFSNSNLRINDDLVNSQNQQFILNEKIITFNVLGILTNSSIHKIKMMEEKGNPDFKKDSEFFKPGVLDFNCND